MLACGTPAPAQSVFGLWEGTVVVDGLTIPFRIEISGASSDVKGAFLNGDERVTSTAGHVDGDSLVLNFDEYAETLRGTLKDGELKGTIDLRSNLLFQLGAELAARGAGKSHVDCFHQTIAADDGRTSFDEGL